jgi:hypothetical protein
MKRASGNGSKKAQTGERRRKARASRAPERPARKRASPPAAEAVAQETCQNCAERMGTQSRALFVEEEVGRIFCSERCIAAFFTPEIERLEKEYHRRSGASDLTREERDGLAHLRWVTLQEPDEVWREKTLTGDYRYTLISEFQPGNRRVWCVCICLFLRGEPSFLYLAFPTRNAALMSQYRRGERIQWPLRARKGREKAAQPQAQAHVDDHPAPDSADTTAEAELPSASELGDRLANPWTEDETLRAQLISERSDDDIPPEEFGLYQSCMDETLEAPDEVWAFQAGGEDSARLYHFIRNYPEESPGVWFIIVAREASAPAEEPEEEDQIEILDAFPTRDAALVDRYRRGEQEIGEVLLPAPSRVVH